MSCGPIFKNQVSMKPTTMDESATVQFQFSGHRPYEKKKSHYKCRIKVLDDALSFDNCNKGFDSFQSLSNHIEEVHNWSSKVPECCQSCEVYLKNKCEFFSHLMFHLNEIHTDKEPFNCCEACEKMLDNIFETFQVKKCQTFVTMPQRYFSYTDLTQFANNENGENHPTTADYSENLPATADQSILSPFDLSSA